MDVRGSTDSHEANNKLSQLRQEILRFEAAEGPPDAKGTQSQLSVDGSEIVQLLQQLKAMPEVRAELVELAVTKLREGHFSTRESAERTAEAVLRTISKE